MDYQSPTEIIKEVGSHLSKKIPSDKQKMKDHLIDIESVRFALSEALVNQHKALVELRQRMLHPKDKDLTELDRNTMLDANASVYKRDYEFLEKLDELVRDRIEIIKTLLLFN